MSKKLNVVQACVFACFGSFIGTSLAGDLYLEPRLGLNRGNLPNVGSFLADNNSTSGGLLVGYKVTDQIAIETGYIDFGKIGYSTSSGGTASLFNGVLTSSGTWSGSVTAKASGIPIGLSLTAIDSDAWNMNLRVGYMWIDGSVTAVVNTGSGTYSGGFSAKVEEPYFGAGLGYKLSPETQVRFDVLTLKIDASAYRVNQYGLTFRKDF